jgi:hypothetical protein
MVEQEPYCNLAATPFPFEAIRPEHRASIAKELKIFEDEDTVTPHATFVTALNAVLVWAGARTATLPAWSYMTNPARIVNFLEYLNHSSKCLHKVQKITVLNRPQIYRSGEGVEHGLIVRQGNPRVRFDLDRPVRDNEIGRELDMYPPNCDFFAGGYEMGDTAFSVWEVGTESLLYAEAFSDDLLSPMQLEEFILHCENRVALWNAAMANLGLSYRFYGTMDWKRSDSKYHGSTKTRKYCGKEFLGADCRDTRFQFTTQNSTDNGKTYNAFKSLRLTSSI